MKRIHSIALLAAIALLLAGGVVAAADEASGGWFDMANCEMCAPMMAEKGLMENMKWESFPIATGMIDVATVPAAYEAAYARAHP